MCLHFMRSGCAGRIAVRRCLEDEAAATTTMTGHFVLIFMFICVLFSFLFPPPPKGVTRQKRLKISLLTAGSTVVGQGGTAASRGRFLCRALCWAGPSPGGDSAVAAARLLFAAPYGAEPSRVVEAAAPVLLLLLEVGGC